MTFFLTLCEDFNSFFFFSLEIIHAFDLDLREWFDRSESTSSHYSLWIWRYLCVIVMFIISMCRSSLYQVFVFNWFLVMLKWNMYMRVCVCVRLDREIFLLLLIFSFFLYVCSNTNFYFLNMDRVALLQDGLTISSNDSNTTTQTKNLSEKAWISISNNSDKKIVLSKFQY